MFWHQTCILYFTFIFPTVQQYHLQETSNPFYLKVHRCELSRQVSRISTDLKTEGLCYTDSNGREMISRKRSSEVPDFLFFFFLF